MDERSMMNLVRRKKRLGSVMTHVYNPGSLMKKGRVGFQAQQTSASLLTANVEKKFESPPQMVLGVSSDDAQIQIDANMQFRILLSIEQSPPIEEVIQSGVVPRLVEFLQKEDCPLLQFETAWALTNIETSENTKVVIDHGAIPIFVKLLDSPSDDVREQAVWALGNVAGDSLMCRDLVLPMM